MQLEANNIGFRYGKGPWILRNFHMSLNSGEVVGLTGHSGCGKTTLARILSGYEKPQEGYVSLEGEALPPKGFHPVQIIFQHPEKSVNPRWRMRDTVNEGWEVDEGLLERLVIEKDWLNRWPNELSGGELQRFCVARALSPQARFIIADEMTTMLDAITQAQIWQVVLDIAHERQMGVLIVSHEQSIIKRLCHRVINLSIDIAE
jgi:peptide/nickel transport system ATP-binding protein